MRQIGISSRSNIVTTTISKIARHVFRSRESHNVYILLHSVCTNPVQLRFATRPIDKLKASAQGGNRLQAHASHRTTNISQTINSLRFLHCSVTVQAPQISFSKQLS